MRIGPSDDPWVELYDRFQLRARQQREPFRHGQTPHAEQEGQWVEALDQRRRVEGMPRLHVLINLLVQQGYPPEEICDRLKVSPSEILAAIQAWQRDPPPEGGVDMVL